MRGCLFVILAGLAVVAGAAWFGAAPLTSTVIASILEGSGYHAASSTITASADPPPRLLLGHADRVTIDGRDVTWRTFRAARLELTLRDVDLFGRTARSVEGTIEGAELSSVDDPAPTADVAIEGTGSEADATIRVAGTTVDRLVKAGFSKRFGVTVDSTTLVAPDTLRITAAGTTIQGRLIMDAAGALTLSTTLGSADLFRFDPSFPLQLTTVRVRGADLELTGTLDPEALLGG
jgi:hypothetical protein